jgi:tetratricopeptide (TPR) repeat protein
LNAGADIGKGRTYVAENERNSNVRKRTAQNRKSNTTEARKTGPVRIELTIPVAVLLTGTALGLFLLGYVAGVNKSSDTARTSAPMVATVEEQQDMQALNSLKTQVELHPGDGGLRLQYANGLHDAGMADEAIKQYEIYLNATPGDVDARIDLGVCYYMKSDFDKAIKEMKQAISKSPSHLKGIYNLGIVYLGKGDTAVAISYIEKALSLDPGSKIGQSAASLLKQITR